MKRIYDAEPTASSALPRIRVSGSIEDRSRQYGQLAREQIRYVRSQYERVFADAGVSWDDARVTALRYRDAIVSMCPALLVEAQGIADGCELDLADILAINCRTEILNAVTANRARAIENRMGECSSFALSPGRTTEQETLLGQNWDWLEVLEAGVIVLEVERDDGPNYVTMVEAGLLAKASLNQHGFAIGLNTLVSSQDARQDGVPYHFMIRALLESKSVAHALEILSSMTRATSANYLVGTAQGAIINVETSPGGVAGINPQLGTNGLVLHTNHFLGTLHEGYDLASMSMSDSFVRFQRLTSLLPEERARFSVEELQTALADHVEAPYSICCHPSSSEPELQRWKTLFSVVMNVQSRRIRYTVGPPCSGQWQDLQFGDLLQEE